MNNRRFVNFLSILKEYTNNFSKSQWLVYTEKVNTINDNQNFDWVFAKPLNAVLHEQGWKLHISSTTQQAIKVMDKVLPILVDSQALFKCTGSIEFLANLNDGRFGMQQIGKFITVYPNNEAHLRRLAEILYVNTCEFVGPKIITDKQYKISGIVYYRWSGFLPKYTQTYFGAILPLITRPNGDQIIDKYSFQSISTANVIDPLCEEKDEDHSRKIINNHYVKISPIHIGQSSEVYLGFDIKSYKRCIIKCAYKHSQLDAFGLSTLDRIKYEINILKKLKNLINVPDVYDEFLSHGIYYLVMEDIGGMSLYDYLKSNITKGVLPDPNNAIRIIKQITNMIKILHDNNIINADIKLSNFIITKNNDLYMIDFNSSSDLSNDLLIFASGSKGFASSNRRQNGKPSFSDDIFSLGALMYYLCTNLDPHQVSISDVLKRIKPSQINPNILSSLELVIEKCLYIDENKRYKTIKEFQIELEASCLERKSQNITSFDNEISKQLLSKTVKEYGNFLIQTFYDESKVGCGFAVNTQGHHKIIDLRGTAGCVLALLDLYNKNQDKELLHVIEKSSKSLMDFKADYNELPGLYVGSSSVALVLCLSGVVLAKDSLLHNGIAKIQSILEVVNPSPDIINGRAGYLRALLMTYLLTKNSSVLDIAHAQASYLYEHCLVKYNQPPVWRTVKPFSTEKKVEFEDTYTLSYAHGVAGIADVLLDYYSITNDIKIKKLLADVVTMLEEQVILDEDLVYWSRSYNYRTKANVAPFFWCLSGGIVKFLIRAYNFKISPTNYPILDKALSLIYQNARTSIPIQCHGLLGNAEILLDMLAVSGNNKFYYYANDLTQILLNWEIDIKAFNFNSAHFHPKGWLSGIPGIITFLTRMLDPVHNPHILSLDYCNQLVKT